MSSSGQKAPIRVKRTKSSTTQAQLSEFGSASTSADQPSTSTSNALAPPLTPLTSRPNLSSNRTPSSNSLRATSRNQETAETGGRGWFGLGRSRSHSNQNLPTHQHRSNNPQVDWVRDHTSGDDRLAIEMGLAERADETERRERGEEDEYHRNARRGSRGGVVESLAREDRENRETKLKKEKESQAKKERLGLGGRQRSSSTGLFNSSQLMSHPSAVGPPTSSNESKDKIGNQAESRQRTASRATAGHLPQLGRLSEDHSSVSLPQSQPQLQSHGDESVDYFSSIPESSGNEVEGAITPKPNTPPGLTFEPSTPRSGIQPDSIGRTSRLGNALKNTKSSNTIFSLKRRSSGVESLNDLEAAEGKETDDERRQRRQDEEDEADHHAEEVVDYLDVIDPEVR